MKKGLKDIILDDQGEKIISITPIDSEGADENVRNNFLELQLVMATSSINHEYARMEFEDTQSLERKEELLEYMHDCREEYFKARENLERINPHALKDFEEDLIRQKRVILSQYNA